MGRIRPPHIASVASAIPTPLLAHFYGAAVRSKSKFDRGRTVGLGRSASGTLLEPFELLAISDIRACA
jgi:hypothetical protein